MGRRERRVPRKRVRRNPNVPARCLSMQGVCGRRGVGLGSEYQGEEEEEEGKEEVRRRRITSPSYFSA